MSAKKLFVPYNFNSLEIQNAVAQNLASAPAGTAPGLFYYDTTLGRFQFRGASAWIDPTARANHSGTQLATTVSDLAATVQAYKLNQFAAPVANIPMGGFTFTGLATPNAAGQAAEYSWVQGQVQAAAAGIDSKPSVAVVATTNQASLSGLLTIDGVTLTAGQRVLLVAQTTATQNGVYVAAASAWARDTDTITPQAFWFVETGTVGAGTQWKVSTSGTITLGSTALTISQFGASQSYTNGNGLSLASNVFSVLTPGSSGILVSGTGVAIDTSLVVRKFLATLGDGSTLSFAVTHNLGSLDVQCQAYDTATFATVECDVVRTSTTVATFIFAVAPTAGQIRALVQG